MKTVKDFDTIDTLEQYRTAVSYHDSCYDALAKNLSSQPYLVELLDAVIRHAKTLALTQHELHSKGLTNDEIGYLAMHLYDK